jgi:hypothetical protein
MSDGTISGAVGAALREADQVSNWVTFFQGVLVLLLALGVMKALMAVLRYLAGPNR